jgi:hypothetical protein
VEVAGSDQKINQQDDEHGRHKSAVLPVVPKPVIGKSTTYNQEQQKNENHHSKPPSLVLSPAIAGQNKLTDIVPDLSPACY